MRTNIRSPNYLTLVTGLALSLGINLNGVAAEAQTTDHGLTGYCGTEDGVSIVEVRRCDDTLCSYPVSFPSVVGDPKANTDLCNLQSLGGLKRGQEGHRVDSSIVDPVEGQACWVGLIPKGAVTLKVDMGDSLFSESVVWRRGAFAIRHFAQAW